MAAILITWRKKPPGTSIPGNAFTGGIVWPSTSVVTACRAGSGTRSGTIRKDQEVEEKMIEIALPLDAINKFSARAVIF